MPIAGNDRFQIGVITVGCSGGAGVITVPAVTTDSGTVLDVWVTDSAGTQVASYVFPTNSANASHQFTGLADGTYTVSSQATSDGVSGAIQTVQKTVSCGSTGGSGTSGPVDDLAITVTVDQPTTQGGEGIIHVSATGTNSPFSFTLDGGQLIENSFVVQYVAFAGAHTVLVTDSAGYTRSQQVTITDPVAVEVLGCTDPTADNYNPDATEGNADENVCTYSPKVFTEVKVVEVLPCADGVCLRWFNSLGGIDTWVFQGKVDRPFASEATGEYSQASGLLAAASKAGKPSMVLHTAGLDYNRYQALWQLYTSPKVWIHHPDETAEEVYVEPASIAPLPLGRRSYDLTVELAKAPINTLRN